jgi:hypothetical protein
MNVVFVPASLESAKIEKAKEVSKDLLGSVLLKISEDEAEYCSFGEAGRMFRGGRDVEM